MTPEIYPKAVQDYMTIRIRTLLQPTYEAEGNMSAIRNLDYVIRELIPLFLERQDAVSTIAYGYMNGKRPSETADALVGGFSVILASAIGKLGEQHGQ